MRAAFTQLIAWPSSLLLAGCLHWQEEPEHGQAPAKSKGVTEVQLRADGPLRAKASTTYPQLVAWPSAEQDKLNKAIENLFVGRYKPAFTEMFSGAAEAEMEFADDPSKIGASFYDWMIKDCYAAAYLTRWVISIRGTHYEYTGGAHGNTTFFNANYWIRRGKIEQVRLSQLFKPMYLWQEQIDQLIRRELRAQEALWLKDVKLDPKRKDLLGAAFTFSEKGLEFHYHPYVVGPYTQGSFHVLLPMAEIRHLIYPGGPMSRLAK